MLKRTSLMLLAGVMACVQFTGCDEPVRQGYSMNPEVDRSDYPRGRGEAKPAPAPAPAPKKAAAPAPAAPKAGTVRSVMTFPSAVTSGDKSCCAKVKLEQVAPAEVALGEPFEYLITVTNDSDVRVENVVVRDALPANFEVIESDPKVAGATGGKAQFNVGALDPGASRTIRIKGRATQPGNLTSCASVTYVPVICVTTAVVQPALTLTKSAPGEVLICDVIPVKIVVTNNGTGVARGVRVVDTLPAGLTTEDGKNSINVEVGDLAAGQSREITVNLKAAKTGKFGSEASATAGGNLKAAAAASTIVREPVLVITKTGPQKMFLGRNFSYTITVNNMGDAPAADTVVTDTLGPGLTFVSATGGGTAGKDGKITWNLGTLAPKAEKTVEITVAAKDIGNYTNSAAATAKCAKGVSATASTAVAGIPAILLEVIDVTDPVEVGQNTTYVIEVTNQGSANGTNITIAADLEDTMQFVSADGATRATKTGARVEFAPLPSLAPKAKTKWQVVVKAAKPGDVRFKVSMKSDQIERPVEETEATNFYK